MLIWFLFFLTSIKHGFVANSQRKQLTLHKPTNGFPATWRQMNEHRNSIQSDLDYLDLDYPDFSIIQTFFPGPIFFMNIGEIAKQQTSDSSWEFLRIEN